VLRKNILIAAGPLDASGSESTRRTVITLTKHLRVFGKFFRRLQQLSSERFASLPLSNELVLFYWSEIVDSTNYPHHVVSGQYFSLVSDSSHDILTRKRFQRSSFPRQVSCAGLGPIQGQPFAMDPGQKEWDAEQERQVSCL
jgi:hypothetical protein